MNYSFKVLDHYRQPRNFGILKKATHTATELNPLCGDEITVYLQVEHGRIKQMKYEARGCALSIAAASLLSESPGEKDIEKLMGVRVSEGRKQCVNLVFKAINKALSSPT